MDKKEMDNLKLELSVKAKNGLDFIIAAAIIWLCISYLWTMEFSAYDKSVLTFIIGGFMLLLAFAFSKVLKTQWKIESNPLQPLGLILNFAQLFYFPFLILVLIKMPDYFVLTYVIITGAHFFPYAWYYNEKAFAIIAGLASVGSLIIALNVGPEQMYLVPLYFSILLLVLIVLLARSLRKKSKI